jgi:hypothetical protein
VDTQNVQQQQTLARHPDAIPTSRRPAQFITLIVEPTAVQRLDLHDVGGVGATALLRRMASADDMTYNFGGMD